MKKGGTAVSCFVRASRAVALVLFCLYATPGLAIEVVGQTDTEAVATVDGVPITATEVDPAIEPKLRPLQMQIYALRKASLEALIANAVLKNEAAGQGITVDALRKQFVSAPVSVSAQDIEESYSEGISAFGAMSPHEARERVRLALETNARMKNYREALARLQSNARIDVLLSEPRVTVAPSVKEASKGRPDAPVTIVEFSDFECPYCRGVAPTLADIARDYEGQVRLVFKHLPLEGHPRALPAARAAVCAAEQSRFWQYHDALFAAESLGPERLDAVAVQVGLDKTR